MRRAALALTMTLTVGLATSAAAQRGGDHSMAGAPAAPEVAATASIGSASVLPARLDVVAGEAVRWTNDSVRVHTVTADDESFDSGRIQGSGTYVHRFASAGTNAYHCTLHPLIQGVVEVHHLLLEAPRQAASPRQPFPISGRSDLPAGTTVSIEADSGTGYTPAATAVTDADGRFSTRLEAPTTASYRAVAGARTSPPVEVRALDHRVALSVRRTGRQLELTAKVTPPTRGGRLVLQLYLPERFGWWPVRAATPDRRSSAAFTLRTRRHLRARVRYTLTDGATPLATSRTVRIGPRPAAHARH